MNRRRPRMATAAKALATAIALLTSSVTCEPKGLMTGVGMRDTGSNACSKQYATVHPSQWPSHDTTACGTQCVQLWRAQGNPEPKLIVKLVGRCQHCGPNDLELSAEPFDYLAIDKNSSSFGIQWQTVVCPKHLESYHDNSNGGSGNGNNDSNPSHTPTSNAPFPTPHTPTPSPSGPSTPQPPQGPSTTPQPPPGPSTPRPSPGHTSTPSIHRGSSHPPPSPPRPVTTSPSNNAKVPLPVPSLSPPSPLTSTPSNGQTNGQSQGGSSDIHNDKPIPNADKRNTRRPAPTIRPGNSSTGGSVSNEPLPEEKDSGSGSNVTDFDAGEPSSKPPPQQGDGTGKGSTSSGNGPKPNGSGSGDSGGVNDTNGKTKFFSAGFFTSPIFIGVFMGIIGFVGFVITYRAKKQRYSNTHNDRIVTNTHSPSVSAALGGPTEELGVGTSRAMYTLTSPTDLRAAVSTL